MPIHLGYEIGTGKPVEIPLAHTFVTGQTQLSGKTTTLRAIVGRSGCRALAFVTKRGEQFEGRRIQPYLPREGEQPIHWRLVETILASALGQRSLKYERLWIVNAAKGAKSLADVRRNVDRLKAKAKGGTADVYMLIGEYLDLVLPEMRALAAADVLDLQPGLNVMDLATVGPQLQALVIRAALERINQHERGVLTVFPEAWEFAPRGRVAPATGEAIAMARKGGVLGNYLLCDSQDIAGVDTVIRQAASVWILGVQRELNELKRTLASIPAGIAKPKSADVATLELGQFYACWGRHSIKTYVQPAWMAASDAEQIARGERVTVHRPAPAAPVPPPAVPHPQPHSKPKPKEADVMTPAQEKKLDQVLEFMQRGVAAQAAVDRVTQATDNHKGTHPAPGVDEDALYQRLKARLLADLPKEPAILRVLHQQPELLVEVERPVLQISGMDAKGKFARLIAEGFFDEARKPGDAFKELVRRGGNWANATVSNFCRSFAEEGFLTVEEGGYRKAPGAKVKIVEK